MSNEEMNEQIAKLRIEIQHLEEEKNRMLIESGEISKWCIVTI